MTPDRLDPYWIKAILGDLVRLTVVQLSLTLTNELPHEYYLLSNQWAAHLFPNPLPYVQCHVTVCRLLIYPYQYVNCAPSRITNSYSPIAIVLSYPRIELFRELSFPIPLVYRHILAPHLSCDYRIVTVTIMLWLWLSCCNHDYHCDCDYRVVTVTIALWLWLPCCDCDYRVVTVAIALWLWLSHYDCDYCSGGSDYHVVTVTIMLWLWLSHCDCDYCVVMMCCCCPVDRYTCKQLYPYTNTNPWPPFTRDVVHYSGKIPRLSSGNLHIVHVVNINAYMCSNLVVNLVAQRYFLFRDCGIDEAIRSQVTLLFDMCWMVERYFYRFACPTTHHMPKNQVTWLIAWPLMRCSESHLQYCHCVLFHIKVQFPHIPFLCIPWDIPIDINIFCIYGYEVLSIYG